MRNVEPKLLVAKISYELGLTHVGSNLGMVDVVRDIAAEMNLDDHFILDAGHAFLAYCAVRQYLKTGDARQMYQHHGTHPDRCDQCGIEVSSGSLGLAGSIGLGMALADDSRQVYVATTDGALQEGIWDEVLRYAEAKQVRNFHVYVNCNGWGAYKRIERNSIEIKFNYTYHIPFRVYQTYMDDYGFKDEQSAHYLTLNEESYNAVVKRITDPSFA